MYVAPTPFGLTSGTAHHQTLILPADALVDERFEQVGDLVRVESPQIVVGYIFDLRDNSLTPECVANPAAGREHRFLAWRLRGMAGEQVRMRNVAEVVAEVMAEADQND
jgi:hypothetical protein